MTHKDCVPSGIVDSERGASAVEYALLAAAIAAVIVIAVFAVGTATGGNFTTTCTNIETGSGGDLSC